MILSKEQIAKFNEACEPLMKFLNDETDPHHSVIVTGSHSELVGGVCSHVTLKHVKD